MKTRFIPLVLVALFATVACESRSSDKKSEPQKQDKPAPPPPGPTPEPQTQNEPPKADQTPTVPPKAENAEPVTPKEEPKTAEVAPVVPPKAEEPKQQEAQPKEEQKPAEQPKQAEATPAPQKEEAPAPQVAPKAEEKAEEPNKAEEQKQAEATPPQEESLAPSGRPLKLPPLEQDEQSRTLVSIQQQATEDGRALAEFVELEKGTHSRDLDKLQKDAVNSPAISLEELNGVLPHPEVKVVRLLSYVLAEPQAQDVPARVDQMSADLFAWYPGQPREVIRAKKLALKNAVTAVANSKLGQRAGPRLFYVSESVDHRVNEARSMNLFYSNVGIFGVSAAIGAVAGTPAVGRRLVSRYEASFLPAIGVRSAAIKNLGALGLESKTIKSLGLSRRWKTKPFEQYGVQDTGIPGFSVALLDNMNGHSLGERAIILVRVKSADNPGARAYYLTSDQLPREEATELVRQLQTAAPDMTRVSRGGVAQYSGRRALTFGLGSLALGYGYYYSGEYLGQDSGRTSESLELLSMVPTDRLKELNQH